MCRTISYFRCLAWQKQFLKMQDTRLPKLSREFSMHSILRSSTDVPPLQSGASIHTLAATPPQLDDLPPFFSLLHTQGKFRQFSSPIERTGGELQKPSSPAFLCRPPSQMSDGPSSFLLPFARGRVGFSLTGKRCVRRHVAVQGFSSSHWISSPSF